MGLLRSVNPRFRDSKAIKRLTLFRSCKVIQDTLIFWILSCGFRNLCQWNLDFEFQTLVGLWSPRAEFRIPKVQETGFHKQKIPLLPYLGRCGAVLENTLEVVFFPLISA